MGLLHPCQFGGVVFNLTEDAGSWLVHLVKAEWTALRTTSQKGSRGKAFEIWQREVLRSLELKENPLEITSREVVLEETRRSD